MTNWHGGRLPRDISALIRPAERMVARWTTSQGKWHARVSRSATLVFQESVPYTDPYDAASQFAKPYPWPQPDVSPVSLKTYAKLLKSAPWMSTRSCAQLQSMYNYSRGALLDAYAQAAEQECLGRLEVVPPDVADFVAGLAKNCGQLSTFCNCSSLPCEAACIVDAIYVSAAVLPGKKDCLVNAISKSDLDAVSAAFKWFLPCAMARNPEMAFNTQELEEKQAILDLLGVQYQFVMIPGDKEIGAFVPYIPEIQNQMNLVTLAQAYAWGVLRKCKPWPANVLGAGSLHPLPAHNAFNSRCRFVALQLAGGDPMDAIPIMKLLSELGYKCPLG